MFHPESTLSLDPKVCNLVSTSFEGTVCLWNLEELSEILFKFSLFFILYCDFVLSEKPIAFLDGHAPYRVSKAEFHPSGQYVATCWLVSSFVSKTDNANLKIEYIVFFQVMTIRGVYGI